MLFKINFRIIHPNTFQDEDLNIVHKLFFLYKLQTLQPLQLLKSPCILCITLLQQTSSFLSIEDLTGGCIFSLLQCLATFLKSLKFQIILLHHAVLHNFVNKTCLNLWSLKGLVHSADCSTRSTGSYNQPMSIFCHLEAAFFPLNIPIRSAELFTASPPAKLVFRV